MRRFRSPRAVVAVAAAAIVAGCGGMDTTIGAGGSVATRAGDVPVELPVTRCGDFFIADVMLNGRGPFRLKLDTGFPRTQLTPATASALGVGLSLRSIEVGEFRVDGRIPIGVSDLDAVGLALGEEIDGILGYTVFQDVLLTYDFPAGEVRVGGGSLPAHAPGTIPMDRGIRPFVRGRLGGETLSLLLDTGSSGGISLLDLSDRTLQEEARIVGSSVRVDGIYERWGGRLTDDLVFGDAFTVRQPVVTNAIRRNLLGQDVLRHFVVTLDRAQGLVRFEPADGAGTRVIELPSLRSTGLVLAPEGHRFRVAAVLEGSPAEAAGVLPEDRVLAIDGVAVADRGCPADGHGPSERTSRLTLERGDERFDVSVQSEVRVR